MKKSILLTLVIYFSLSFNSRAQFFLGLRSSPYGGVTNVDYNPAIADNRFQVDINLIGFGANLNNNYVGITRQALLNPTGISGDLQDNDLKERLNGKNKNIALGAQVQGPLSFMFAFGKGKTKTRTPWP